MREGISLLIGERIDRFDGSELRRGKRREAFVRLDRLDDG